MKLRLLTSVLFTGILFGISNHATAQGTPGPSTLKRIAYIYGDVAANGAIPSGPEAPYDQMLLTDSGSTGLSIFRQLVETEGYQIDQFYDATTTLNAAFLDQFDGIIFGLHQKIWSNTEKNALDAWLRSGGRFLTYSDSASGGRFNLVGIKNPVGQNAVNNLTSAYGLQVTVDQGGGTRAYTAPSTNAHPIVEGPLILEGEGVSPVAVDPNSGAEVLIAFGSSNQISGSGLNIDAQGVTISNPLWASLALQSVGSGHILVMFDRQPMWNSGPGSDISKRDNTEILRRIVRFLVGELSGPDLDPQFTATPTSGNAPLLVQFDASASNAINGPIASYAWDFTDDGIQDQTGVSASHLYPNIGTFVARLTITDSLGETASLTQLIEVTDPSPPPSQTPTAGLIAEWLFSESSGPTTPDTSGFNRDGTLDNASRTTGYLGGGMAFNGSNSRVAVPTFELDGPALTLSAWIRWEGASTVDSRIFSKASNTTASNHIVALGTHTDGRLRARLKTGGSTTELFTPNQVISVQTWHHVALRYDGSVLQILVDGDVVAFTSQTGIIDTAPSIPVAIGNQPSGAGDRPFNGILDQIRIYDRALSAAEINALANESLPPASFAEWISGLSSPPPPDQRGPSDTPLGNGISNLLVYALGGHPMIAGSTPLPGVSLLPATSELPPVLSLTYRRFRSTLTYTVVGSTDLLSNTWTSNGIDQGSGEVGSEVTATLPLDPTVTSAFLRLEVVETTVDPD